MKAVFIEMPAFARLRPDYLDDDGYRSLQDAMMQNPEAGDVIEGTGGLRKLRHGDPRRSKGKRGGLRVIYYWWDSGSQFWMYTLYDKGEMDDLSAQQRRALKDFLKAELDERR
jgi:mRNA-degrading endonuclease RelE of RelBE toxin-antitoxin system